MKIFVFGNAIEFSGTHLLASVRAVIWLNTKTDVEILWPTVLSPFSKGTSSRDIGIGLGG